MKSTPHPLAGRTVRIASGATVEVVDWASRVEVPDRLIHGYNAHRLRAHMPLGEGVYVLVGGPWLMDPETLENAEVVGG